MERAFDEATAKHVKKKVTILPQDAAAESCDPRQKAANELREFFVGPGYPGVSKNWRGREALYAERENQLLRRRRRRNDQS
jgi:hypothetical protein